MMGADARFSELRRTQRLLLSRKGEIHDGTTSIKALIRNASTHGMLLVCDKIYTPGQTLGVKFQAASGDIIDCQVEVRHSSDAGTGVEIVAMREAHRRAYEQYLQENRPQRPGGK